jgi:membrane protease YdiL (CAAX protease family)
VLPPSLRVAIAWCVIALTTIGWLGMHRLGSDEGEGRQPAAVNGLLETQARMMHGLLRFADDWSASSPALVGRSTDLRPAPGSPWIDSVAFAIFLADADGPAAGLAELDTHAALAADASDEDRALAASVRTRIEAWEAGRDRPPLEEREAARLGWFAEVLAGTAPVSNIAFTLFAFFSWYVLAGFFGFVLLVVLLILAAVGKLDGLLPSSGSSHIYAETFALWFLLFAAFNIGVGVLFDAVHLGEYAIFGATAAFFASLVALAWPVVCGVPWGVVRSDIGLTSGRGLLRELIAGPVIYAMALPIMGAGLLVFVLLQALVPEAGPPSHPAAEQLGAGAMQLVGIFLVACVAAPIVEEIAFRGVLYRHLRDLAPWTGAVASGVVAAVVSSVLFAAIHPQGPLFIPVLGGLAVGFCIGREWRGCLPGCIVAHGIQNGVTLSLGVLLAHG